MRWRWPSSATARWPRGLHESLNLAALWQLPLLFLCENNGWAEFSPTHKQFVAPLDKLSAAFSIPHAKVDGNDVLAVMDAAQAAVADIRAGKGPRVLECITHRWRGHYEGDPQKYRDSDEISGLDEHDPVARFEAVLDSKGVSQAQRQKVRDAVQAQVDQAVERARKGRPPVWETARTDVYTQAEAR